MWFTPFTESVTGGGVPSGARPDAKRKRDDSDPCPTSPPLPSLPPAAAPETSSELELAAEDKGAT